MKLVQELLVGNNATAEQVLLSILPRQAYNLSEVMQELLIWACDALHVSDEVAARATVIHEDEAPDRELLVTQQTLPLSLTGCRYFG
jgi:hypothetical protein